MGCRDQFGKELQDDLTLLNHHHVETFVLILLVTYMRLSELPALIKKDLVRPLVLFLPCWSVVIAVSETGVSTKMEVHHWSVLMKQRWLY